MMDRMVNIVLFAVLLSQLNIAEALARLKYKPVNSQKFRLKASRFGDYSLETDQLSFHVRVFDEKNNELIQTFYIGPMPSRFPRKVELKRLRSANSKKRLREIKVIQRYDNRAFENDIYAAQLALSAANYWARVNELYEKIGPQEQRGWVGLIRGLTSLKSIDIPVNEVQNAVEALKVQIYAGNRKNVVLERLVLKSIAILSAAASSPRGGIFVPGLLQNAARKIAYALIARADRALAKGKKYSFLELFPHGGKNLFPSLYPRLSAQMSVSFPALFSEDGFGSWVTQGFEKKDKLPLFGKIVIRPFRGLPLYALAFHDRLGGFKAKETGSLLEIETSGIGFGIFKNQKKISHRVLFYFEGGVATVSNHYFASQEARSNNDSIAGLIRIPKQNPYLNIGTRSGSRLFYYFSARIQYLGFEYEKNAQTAIPGLPKYLLSGQIGLGFSLF